jgi:hypothetical protein
VRLKLALPEIELAQPFESQNTNGSPFGFRMNCHLLASRRDVESKTTPGEVSS